MAEAAMTETMAGAYIIDAVRTPVGRRGGGLAAAHPADLGAHVIAALIARTGIDPADVDDVVFPRTPHRNGRPRHHRRCVPSGMDQISSPRQLAEL